MLFHPVHYYYSAGDWLWSIFSTLLFIAFVVFAIMLLVRTLSGPRHGVTGPGARTIRGPYGMPPPWYGPAGAPGTSATPDTSAVPGTCAFPGTSAAPGTPTGTAAEAAPGRQGEAFGAARILAARYARGEISEEEFRERAEVLRQAVAGWRAADGQDRAAAQQSPEQSTPKQPPPPQPQTPHGQSPHGQSPHGHSPDRQAPQRQPSHGEPSQEQEHRPSERPPRPEPQPLRPSSAD